MSKEIPLFLDLIKRIETKRRLKATFKRKPRAARIIPIAECCNYNCDQGRDCPLRKPI